MKQNVIVALVVGGLLGFAVGRATKADAPPAPQAAAPSPSPSRAPSPAPGRGSEDPAAVYKIPVGNSPVFGPATAKVTIIEATDFQCPFCSRGNTTMHEVLKAYGNDVRIAVKQNPLSFHQNAFLAASAALAAHEQGKYWQMHDKLFQNQDKLDRASIEGFAQELGLDMSRFRQALDTQKFKERIEAEQKMVVGLGAGGTPSFFINGRKLIGAQPLDRFKQLIDEEMKKADALLAKGTRPEALYEEIIANGATSPVMLPGGAPEAAPEDGGPAPSAWAKVEVPATAPTKGPKHAKVTIVEFSDFQCPFCSRGANTINDLLAAYPKDVRLVFRNMPLPMHPEARPAAKAAYAAGKQGKFFEMHDLLFANQQALGAAKYEEFATQLKLDLAKFKSDMASPEADQVVSQDAAAYDRIGNEGTPAFFINGRKVIGAQPINEFKRVVDEEIKRADEVLKTGVPMDKLYDKLMSMPPPEPPRVQLEPGTAPLRGAPNAKVKVYLFSDFQCPFCSRAVPVAEEITKAYGNKVGFYFKQYPLPFHDKAQLAAEASLAAHEQGKFWAMHDLLFKNQQKLERADLEGYAKELGLNLAKFNAALDSGKFRDQVKKEMAEGSSAGVDGTPTFIVNGKPIVGAQPFDQFKQAIDAELAK